MNQIQHRQRLRQRAGLGIDQPLTPTTMAAKPVKASPPAEPSTVPPEAVITTPSVDEPVQATELVPPLEPIQAEITSDELTYIGIEPVMVTTSPLAQLPFSTDTQGMTPAEQQQLADDITTILTDCQPSEYTAMLDALGAANPVLYQIVVDKLHLLSAQ